MKTCGWWVVKGRISRYNYMYSVQCWDSTINLLAYNASIFLHFQIDLCLQSSQR